MICNICRLSIMVDYHNFRGQNIRFQFRALNEAQCIFRYPLNLVNRLQGLLSKINHPPPLLGFPRVPFQALPFFAEN